MRTAIFMSAWLLASSTGHPIDPQFFTGRDIAITGLLLFIWDITDKGAWGKK